MNFFGTLTAWALGRRSGRLGSELGLDAAGEDLNHEEAERLTFLASFGSSTSAAGGALCWVCKDLAQARSFIRLEDCFRWKINRVDTKPTKISFSRDIHGKDGKEAYATVLNRGMEEGRRWVWQPEPRPRPP